MRHFSKRGVLFLAIVGMAVLFQYGAQAAGGRATSLCKKSCKITEKSCKDRCTPTCEVLFPGGGSEFDSCVGECNGACRDERHDCSDICKAAKSPPSPEEP